MMLPTTRLFSSVIFSCSKISRSYQSGNITWPRIPIKLDGSQEISTKITTLSNGVRIATHKLPVPTATVGLFIDSGSRYETTNNNGVAHFFEHMAFKGSNKVSQAAMEMEVEQTGTRLFAYTSRETTVYYGKCFSSNGGRVVEILSDIIQNPILSETAIERERSVIHREAEDIETQMNEVVFDNLHSTAYQGSPLAYTILGTSENINKIRREDLLQYIKTHYTGPRTILVAVGDVEHSEYVKHAEKYLSSLPSSMYGSNRSYILEPSNYLGSSVVHREDDMPFAHCAVAYEGFSASHADFLPLLVASTLVGSYDQSNSNAKQAPGFLSLNNATEDLARSYMSFNTCYRDTSLWGIYFVVDRHNIYDFLILVAQAWRKLQRSLTDGLVEQAKNSLKTSFLMQSDGTTPLFEEIGRQILAHGNHMSCAEMNFLIDNITSNHVHEAVSRLIMGKDPVGAAIGPTELFPDYYSLRRLFASRFN